MFPFFSNFSLEFIDHTSSNIAQSIYSMWKFQLECILARARASLTTKTLQASSTVLNQLKIIMQFILVDVVDWSSATATAAAAATTAVAMMMTTTTTTDNSIQEWYETLHYTQQCTASRNVARVLRHCLHVCARYVCVKRTKNKKENKPVEHIVHESSSFCCTYRSRCRCRRRMCTKYKHTRVNWRSWLHFSSF